MHPYIRWKLNQSNNSFFVPCNLIANPVLRVLLVLFCSVFEGIWDCAEQRLLWGHLPWRSKDSLPEAGDWEQENGFPLYWCSCGWGGFPGALEQHADLRCLWPLAPAQMSLELSRPSLWKHFDWVSYILQRYLWRCHFHLSIWNVKHCDQFALIFIKDS